MSIYEYNEEYVRKSLFEDGVETGYNQGYDSGNVQGDARRLVQSVESIMANLNVDLSKSCEILGVTVEEYEKAKNSTNS